MVKILVRAPGIDVNKALKNDGGATPLRMAAANGHQEVVMALVQAPGIKVCEDGTPPLMFDLPKRLYPSAGGVVVALIKGLFNRVFVYLQILFRAAFAALRGR